ncbi:hypothetical protein B0H14DRAFT_3161231 [Mycena olivaceomarginata]|nr:hypothetical protein B0H14DRAFT_3161231 [Mycena olivaceomarginata]
MIYVEIQQGEGERSFSPPSQIVANTVPSSRHTSKSQRKCSWQCRAQLPGSASRCRSHAAADSRAPSQAGITPSIPDEPTDHLRNAPKIQMWVIWQELGHDKKRWNSFRSAKLYCRDVATSGCLNWDGNWKSQRSEKTVHSI